MSPPLTSHLLLILLSFIYFYSGVNVGIYTTNKPDVCRFIAEDSKADIIVAEDEKQLQKILSVSGH